MRLFRILTASFIFLLVCVSFLIYSFINEKPSKGSKMIYPFSFLAQNFAPFTYRDDLWFPKITSVFDSGITKPDITAKAAVSYDLTTDKLLFNKNIDVRYPIASLSKIMTAVIALQSYNLDKKITINKFAASIGEDVMGTSEGEEYFLKDLLYGLILHSGNDAAEAIASADPGGRENFIYLMNKKAEDLGLSETHFTNPTGLEGDGRQYSSVYDLLVITRFALLNSDFAKIVSTYEYEIPYSEKHKEIDLFNETNLLTSYPGVEGVKTGYTDEAGLCLVSYLNFQGHKIIGILLGSQNRRQEMIDLLDYSLETLGTTPPPHS